jgi:hypothetical protein
MCKALARGGVPDGNLLVLGPGASDPLGSDVVLATAALRGVFGGRLDSVYAPLVLASFGAGTARIDVRAVAPDGAAALRLALAGDLRARRAAGAELLRDPRLEFSASARAQVAAGGPDARLLITLAVLAAGERVQLLGFSDAGPGAGPDLPLRAARLAVPASAAADVLAFLRAQRPPYLAAHVSTAAGPGRSVLTIEFAAPSPLGLLNSKIKSSLSERTSVPPPEADPSLPSCTRPATCAATRAGDRCTHKESRSGAGGPAPGKGERDEHQPHLGLCRAEPGPGGRLRPGADGRAADGRAALRQRRSVRDPDGVPRGHRRAGGVDHVA